jgi:hypothetical protein
MRRPTSDTVSLRADVAASDLGTRLDATTREVAPHANALHEFVIVRFGASGVARNSHA